MVANTVREMKTPQADSELILAMTGRERRDGWEYEVKKPQFTV